MSISCVSKYSFKLWFIMAAYDIIICGYSILTSFFLLDISSCFNPSQNYEIKFLIKMHTWNQKHGPLKMINWI